MAWQTEDPFDITAWPSLPPGTALTIVKLAPDGSEVTRYPGEVFEAGAPPPWVAVQASWVSREYDLNGLRFVKGDTLHEFFSPQHPFNVFSVFSASGSLRGWYANVTYPTQLDLATTPPTLTWHDLYVDIVALPDGTVAIRDEDELAAACLAATNPAVFQMIVEAKEEILRRISERAFPFHEH
jgi:hypothetical protein